MTRSRASAKKAGTILRTPRPLAERLWSRVKHMPSGCWEWQGYRMPFGHGQISIAGRRVTTTHRVAWELANGRQIPAGMVVRHRCDNPPCCNPDHLEVGTPQDNVKDAVERNRVARGRKLPGTVLSDDQVAQIRARYRRFTVPGQRGYRTNRHELAAEYGVSAKYITAIVGGRERANGQKSK